MKKILFSITFILFVCAMSWIGFSIQPTSAGAQSLSTPVAIMQTPTVTPEYQATAKSAEATSIAAIKGQAEAELTVAAVEKARADELLASQVLQATAQAFTIRATQTQSANILAQAVELNESKRLDNIATELENESKAQDSAWIAPVIGLVALLIVLGLVAGWVVSLVKNPKPVAAMPIKSNAQAVQPPSSEKTYPCPLSTEELEEWFDELYALNNTLSMTQWDNSMFADKYGQGKSRAMIHWIQRVGYCTQDTTGLRHWTDDGINWIPSPTA